MDNSEVELSINFLDKKISDFRQYAEVSLVSVWVRWKIWSLNTSRGGSPISSRATAEKQVLPTCPVSICQQHFRRSTVPTWWIWCWKIPGWWFGTFFPYIGMIIPNIWNNMVDGMIIPNLPNQRCFSNKSSSAQFCQFCPFFFRQTWLTPAEGGSLQGWTGGLTDRARGGDPTPDAWQLNLVELSGFHVGSYGFVGLVDWAYFLNLGG